MEHSSTPPKNRPIISIPKDVDMWSDSTEATNRRAKANSLVKVFRKLAREAKIPKGWTVEIHGGD